MLIKRKYKNQSTLRLILIAGLIFLSGILIGKQVLALHSVPNSLYQVIEVIDGDTFKVENGHKVRLLGIDAPEKGECYYEQAKQALKKLIGYQYIILEKDITE